MGCGHTAETQELPEDPEETEAPGHKPYCAARKNAGSDLIRRGVWLTARLQGDVVELELPDAVRGIGHQSWRTTLAEALLLGIRETMQAGRRDLDWFERRQQEEPVALVLYDTMPGGTGYIPKLFVEGATGLKAACAEAARRLSECDCVDSCHRCLRDFWNQRHHPHLSRFEALGPLQRLANQEVIEGLEPEDDKLESFLEREFFERLTAAKLPAPTLQVVRVVGERRIIRVDCAYRDPNVSIFLDGRKWHTQSEEKILDDLRVRNDLEGRGDCVLEYTYGDVMDDFDRVTTELRAALNNTTLDPDLDVKTLPGITVRDADYATKRVVVSVDPGAWMAREKSRLECLRSCNRARLAGWRLKREPRQP